MNDVAHANRLLLKKLVVIGLGMFGFAFALIPFYRAICEATGVNWLTRADAAPVNSQVDATRVVTVQFDANPQPGSALELVPEQAQLRLHPGEFGQVSYRLSNRSDKPVAVQALPAYAPAVAAEYIKKLECFCFREQVLAAGQTVTLPVVLVVEKTLPAALDTLTLSYRVVTVEGRSG